MKKKQWYEALFENYAQKYDEEVFTKGTSGECDFIEKELNFDRSLRILDVGCGTGRHSIELANLICGEEVLPEQIQVYLFPVPELFHRL